MSTMKRSGGTGRCISNAKEFWEAGMQYIAGHGGQAVEIKPGSPELAAWVAYFHYLGFVPWMIERGRIASAITMPTADPCEFDPSYAAMQAARTSPASTPTRATRPLPTERRWKPEVVR